jgi:hypothetical protein
MEFPLNLHSRIAGQQVYNTLWGSGLPERVLGLGNNTQLCKLMGYRVTGTPTKIKERRTKV